VIPVVVAWHYCHDDDCRTSPRVHIEKKKEAARDTVVVVVVRDRQHAEDDGWGGGDTVGRMDHDIGTCGADQPPGVVVADDKEEEKEDEDAHLDDDSSLHAAAVPRMLEYRTPFGKLQYGETVSLQEEEQHFQDDEIQDDEERSHDYCCYSGGSTETGMKAAARCFDCLLHSVAMTMMMRLAAHEEDVMVVGAATAATAVADPPGARGCGNANREKWLAHDCWYCGCWYCGCWYCGCCCCCCCVYRYP
jgi:hypothetical protein